MRTLLVLTCCLALTAVGRAEDQDSDQNKGKKKKNEQTTQQAGASTGNQAGNAAQTGKQKLYTPNNFRSTQSNLPAVQSNTPTGRKSSSVILHEDKWKGPSLNAKGQVQSNAISNPEIKTKQKTWVVQNFKLQKNTQVSAVQFQANAHIAGSQNWQGQNYTVFRLYTAQRHDRIWWTDHYDRIILIGGGYYYWDNGFWCPAWGYDPAFEFYAYDGPICGYNDLPPDQVIANVQAALQRQGYYHGLVDGMLGPLTHAALASYQAAHGLYPTSAIDEPTLASLGMV